MSSRDKDIQYVFEIADDSLQGILGHYMYVLALHSASNIEKIVAYLPNERFPMTFSWDRFYQKQDLIQAFKSPLLQFYQARISLISIVTTFEVALNGFITHLVEKGYNQELKNQKLQWAYEQLTPCDIGDTEAIKRIPTTFGIIDNARRLRNLIVHNQGLFNERYELDALEFRDIKVDMHPQYALYKSDPLKPIPVIFDTPYFLNFSKVHLEVLHLLHNKIQKKYFGCNTGYDYIVENKPIEWDRALWGKAKVTFQSLEKTDNPAAL
jgi:hypothetical protein